jgi:hypothetical protein
MKTFKHYAAASLGLVLFVSVIALSLPQVGHSALTPPDKDVRVINTATEAVPVSVQGTPTVKAVQQGPWNVAIAGTPAVSVSNSEGNPLSIRDVDRPTAQPFQYEVDLTVGPGFGGQNAFVPVPAGKLLVIEHVSAFGYTPNDQEIDTFAILTHVAPDNTYRFHYLDFEKRSVGTQSTYTVSESLRLYADTPGATVRASRLGSTGSVTFKYTVSGYLVDKN